MIYRDLEIELRRKQVRTLRLIVKPDGRVCMTVPLLAPDADILRMLETHYSWLKKSQEKILQRCEKQQRLHYEEGEVHLVWGVPHVLHIEEEWGRESVAVYSDQVILYCHPGRTEQERMKLLYQGYYPLFKQALEDVIRKWQVRLNEPNIDISIRLMKSEWGSCTPLKRRMTFNVDLVRLTPDCMEYVVIHEFSHLTHCNHSPAFWRLCDERLSEVGLPDSKAMRAKMKGMIVS